MKKSLNRRDFLKNTSLSAAGVTVMSYTPWVKALGTNQDKSTVVVAKDEKCITWPGQDIDQNRIQDMVDHCIMTLTGVNDKSKAYEALFPKPVTSSTKILIHYNTMKPKNTQRAVTGALKKGLGYMLNNSFPTANVRIVDREGSANTNQKVNITSSLVYTIKDIWVDCDYFINCPHCWAMSDNLGGITMNLKGMITTIGGQSLSRLHNYTLNANNPYMSILSSHPVFKEKQVLCLINAITYSLKTANSGVPDGATHTLIASKDMVASEYMGLQLLKEKGLPQKNQNSANKVLGFAANDKYKLGTNDPNNMNVVNIAPPWTTEILTSGHQSIHTADIEVVSGAAHTQFIHKGATPLDRAIVIYSLNGKKIWGQRSSENRIVWNHIDRYGRKLPSGNYVYKFILGNLTACGKVTVP